MGCALHVQKPERPGDWIAIQLMMGLNFRSPQNVIGLHCVARAGLRVVTRRLELRSELLVTVAGGGGIPGQGRGDSSTAERGRWRALRLFLMEQLVLLLPLVPSQQARKMASREVTRSLLSPASASSTLPLHRRQMQTQEYLRRRRARAY
jgi:hypothetical protein